MGTFSVPLQVGDPAGQRYVEVQALADTGSSYTFLSEELLDELGVTRLEQRRFRQADESARVYWTGQTRVRLDGRELVTLVTFGPRGVEPLLGAMTLELFGLGVDPLGRRLIPVDGLLKQHICRGGYS